HLDTLSPRDWDSLFKLMPEIERTQVFEEFSEIVSKTVRAISELKINPAFNWMTWKEGEAMVNSRDYDYSQLDTITLCKLLAAIIRADRFTECFLRASFSDGTMLKIIKALKNNVDGANFPDAV